MIRIAICDDNPAELKDVSEKIHHCFLKLGAHCLIDCFLSGIDFLKEKNNYYHIIFLDIQMATMSGIDTAIQIRQNNEQSVLIFVSAFDCYCKELISVQPYAFFDKPLDESLLLASLRKVYRKIFCSMDSLTFSSNKTTYTIPIKDIMYVESNLRKVRIFCPDGNVYSYYDKLDVLETILLQKSIIFIRIHQSYLVNTQYIRSYNYENITLHNGTRIDISKKYRFNVRQQYFDALKREEL